MSIYKPVLVAPLSLVALLMATSAQAAAPSSSEGTLIYSKNCRAGDPLCVDISKKEAPAQVPKSALVLPAPSTAESTQSARREHAVSVPSLQKTLVKSDESKSGQNYTFSNDSLTGKTMDPNVNLIEMRAPRVTTKIPCLDEWLSVLAKEDNSIKSLKKGYKVYLSCRDACMSPHDQDFFADCYDWEGQKKFLEGDASPEQMMVAMSGKDLYSCSAERVAEAKRLGKLDNFGRTAGGGCEHSHPSTNPGIDLTFSTLGLGVAHVMGCKDGCNNASATYGELQAGSYKIKRTNDGFFDVRINLALQAGGGLDKDNRKLTSHGTNIGGRASLNLGAYKTLLDKDYLCTPIAGGSLDANAEGRGNMSTTKLVDVSLRAGAGLLCSNKDVSVKIIGNVDAARFNAVLYHVDELNSGTNDDDRRFMVATPGRGYSGQLELATRYSTVQIEAGRAVYAGDMNRKEGYGKVVATGSFGKRGPFAGYGPKEPLPFYLGFEGKVSSYTYEDTPKAGSAASGTKEDVDMTVGAVVGVKFE